ncbi:oligopeptide ABC transporter permease OppB [Spiroplasma endosymbiont of Crioceris asparagi]|uniref:oligopeptide ABC transporter permease OppB n=1 Tax=Spiroplasma endosymbiont of Crioceris asparagi TaxID=3066286 RepID=UPI0030CAAC07
MNQDFNKDIRSNLHDENNTSFENHIMGIEINSSLSKKGELLSKIKKFFINVNYGFNEFNQKRPLVGYSLKRICAAFVTLFLALAILFVLLKMVTPDSAFMSDINFDKSEIKPGNDAYMKLLNKRKESVGLTGPTIQQILRYFYNILPIFEKTIYLIDAKGEQHETHQLVYFGLVFSSKFGTPFQQDVWGLFKKAIPTSFKFGFVAIAATYLIGIPIGILAAKFKDKSVDGIINGFSAFLIAVPPLIIVMFVFLFSVKLFNISTIYSPDKIMTFIVPVFVIVLMYIPQVIVQTRRYVVDEMSSEYTKFAMSKGMSQSRVFFIHIFRNAGIRVIRDIPVFLIATLFGSSIFTEQQWSVDGMSQYIVGGVAMRETFLVMGYVTIAALAGIISSLIADLIMALMDPRVKLTK